MESWKRAWLLWALVLLIGPFVSLAIMAGCGGDDRTARVEGTKPALDLTPGQVSLPFPSRYFTEPDPGAATGERITFSKALPGEVAAAIDVMEETTLLEDSQELDGFSILAPIMIPFDGALDLPSWNDDDLGEAREAGEGFARLYDITQRDRPAAMGLWLSFIEGENVLVLRPGVPLPAGHRVLVCLVGPLEDLAGEPVVRPSLFDAVMQREADLPEDSFVGDLEEVRDMVESGTLGIDSSDVLLAFSFWTNSRIDTIHAIREVLDERDATNPVLPEDVTFEDPTTVMGKFRPPEFRVDNIIPDPLPGQLPVIQGENWIDFLLRLPDDIEGPLPPLISLHGINGTRWSARTYDGFAVFSIDAVQHGDRIEGEPEVPYPFLDFTQPKIFRDNIRQTAADHISLARMIRHISEDPEVYGLPEGLIVETPLSVVGGSLGGINGSYYASVDPRVDHVAALAGGGLFSEFIPDSTYGFFLPAAVHGLSPFEWLILWHIVQAVLDPGDATALAPGLILDPPGGRAPRNALLAMVVGDRSVCNMATESFTWSAGLGVSANAPHNLFGLPEFDLPVEGNIEIDGETVTGLLVEYELSGSPSLLHGEFLGSDALRSQVQHFLDTAVESGVGRIIDPEAK
ncbi:hypothetical protein ACFL4G_02515 [Thermodesulfobacteriota bacterium]